MPCASPRRRITETAHAMTRPPGEERHSLSSAVADQCGRPRTLCPPGQPTPFSLSPSRNPTRNTRCIPSARFPFRPHQDVVRAAVAIPPGVVGPYPVPCLQLEVGTPRCTRRRSRPMVHHQLLAVCWAGEQGAGWGEARERGEWGCACDWHTQCRRNPSTRRRCPPPHRRPGAGMGMAAQCAFSMRFGCLAMSPSPPQPPFTHALLTGHCAHTA